MKYLLFPLIVLLAFVLTACKSDSIVDPPVNNEYTLVQTAENNNVKFEVYNTSGNRLLYGYNDLGFKVFINGAEKNTGFVKFNPTMYHGLGGPSHSTPVDDKFNYNSSKGLFTGYISFIMIDTSAFWAADFNYNDEASIDSIIINVFSSSNKVIVWDNTITERTYVLSLIKPSLGKIGLNDFHLLLHETQNFYKFSEIDNARMYIRPWMETMGHGSSNNVDPVSVGNARYEGKVNFNMGGEWYVYDSVKVNDTWITKTPAPKFIFEVN